MKIDVIDRELVKQDFHQMYYDSDVWNGSTKFLGLVVGKNPMDLWMYQEIIFKVKPRVIIETGTNMGGSAAWMMYCQKLSGVGDGMVITIDIEQKVTFKLPEITQIIGMSTHPASIYTCFDIIGKISGPVMVVLDSGHSKENVIAELEEYAKFVTTGSYLIVEDTNVNGNPVLPNYGPGPLEALEEWLPFHNDEFEVDKECEKFMFTFNPGGYLRRK